jgi:hypothetical protein
MLIQLAVFHRIEKKEKEKKDIIYTIINVSMSSASSFTGYVLFSLSSKQIILKLKININTT